MDAELVNTTLSSQDLPQAGSVGSAQLKDALPEFLLGWPTWQYVVTFVLGVVIYDQG
ncbi:hypothetical protein P170DRAFT_436752, partial [Aspergillus steynii IBT 23096]